MQSEIRMKSSGMQRSESQNWQQYSKRLICQAKKLSQKQSIKKWECNSRKQLDQIYELFQHYGEKLFLSIWVKFIKELNSQQAKQAVIFWTQLLKNTLRYIEEKKAGINLTYTQQKNLEQAQEIEDHLIGLKIFYTNCLQKLDQYAQLNKQQQSKPIELQQEQIKLVYPYFFQSNDQSTQLKEKINKLWKECCNIFIDDSFRKIEFLIIGIIAIVAFIYRDRQDSQRQIVIQGLVSFVAIGWQIWQYNKVKNSFQKVDRKIKIILAILASITIWLDLACQHNNWFEGQCFNYFTRIGYFIKFVYFSWNILLSFFAFVAFAGNWYKKHKKQTIEQNRRRSQPSQSTS